MIQTSAFLSIKSGSRAWIDLLVFTFGLALSAWSGWQTGDLIWSLWLSSLAVGYTMICIGAFAPCLLQWREQKIAAAVWAGIGGLATLAFFTVHFGLFHAGQAAILNDVFPLPGSAPFPSLAFLLSVVGQYWPFLLLTLISERARFRLPLVPPAPPPLSVKASDIEARKARQAHGSLLLFSPYLNVIRMHVLIFSLAGLAYLHLNGAVSYTLVYAVYFLPWRTLHGLFSKQSDQR